MILHLLRSAAIAIALLAAIDPAVTSMRSARPTVALVLPDSSAHSDLAARVEQTLSRSFTVVRGRFPAAAATIVVGERLPDIAHDLAAPAFVVVPRHIQPAITIEALDAPARSQLESRTVLTTTALVSAARGRTVHFTLFAGDIPLDRAERTITLDRERLVVPLQFVPHSAGAAALRVAAEVADHAPLTRAAADVAIDVRDERWTVLFLDRRPSWMSTFVRRAIEGDPRFLVTSRVVTSRNISTDAGAPPAALDDRGALSDFDVIIVGAPESLSERDVSGLDNFLRIRGGAAFLLLDQRETGVYSRWLGLGAWSSISGRDIVSLRTVAADSLFLNASEFIWPAALPPGARPVALTYSAFPDTLSAAARGTPAGSERDAPGAPEPDSLHAQAVIWRTAVGAGRVVVSGALDAWRFRDSSGTGFEGFWRRIVAEAAEAAVQPIQLALSQSVLRPNEPTEVRVTLRNAALHESATSAAVVRSAVSARIEMPDSALPIRLWPSGTAGALSGTLRAPAAPGRYRVTVMSDGINAHTTLIVSGDAAAPAAAEDDVMRGWATSRGGDVFASRQLANLLAAVRATVRPERRVEVWHPMRSLWWILPFALLLGAEWWMRRRRGLA